MAPGRGGPRSAWSLLLAGLATRASCTGPLMSIGNRLLVVIEGSQGDIDAQQALEGVQMGIMKSSNRDLKDQFDDVNFLFLEMNSGGLFEHGEASVLPWLKRHVELLRPHAVLSAGSRASAVVERVAAGLPPFNRPSWHFKCLQDRCPATGAGLAAHETCVDFKPKAKDMLKEVGRLKPGARKVLLLSDGSVMAERLAAELLAVTPAQRSVRCGGCSTEVRRVRDAAEVRSRGPQPAEANSTFMILPSFEGLNATAVEIWEAVRASQAGAFVPQEVMALGGLASFRVHHGGAAEECSVVIAVATSLVGVRPYEARTTSTYKIDMNMQRAFGLPGVEWFDGNLHHSGSEMWEPVTSLWPEDPQVPVRRTPKVLAVHSYGRAYKFTDYEHRGFLRGLQAAGFSLNCHTGLHFCDGDLEVRTLYWHTKFWFQQTSDIAVKATYTKEYIKRWRPDVVFFSDDDVLNHLVVPCFEPLTRGPNPSYHECSGTQYVGSGINGDVRRIFRDKCLEYLPDGTCAGARFFVEAGSSAACGACEVGDEIACASCADLYDKARPVNITLHSELPDTLAVVRMMRSVKPTVQKIVLFSDNTVTSHGWKETIKRQFAQMNRDHQDSNITVDFARDWHMLNTQEEFLAKVQEYQDRPEYMVWIPSTLSFLPMDTAARSDVWERFLQLNTLGEVLAPGETDKALLSAAGHPDSMGRVCAQYASLIVRAAAYASRLPILTTPLSKVFANVGRALQLQGHDIVPIPENVLARADRIFTLCPPGHRLKEGVCEPCPAKTFKDTYGDSPALCMACPTAAESMTGLTSCTNPPEVPTEPGSNKTAWVVAILLVSALVTMLGILAWRLQRSSHSVWLIQESELNFGDGPVCVLGQGTFGVVVKAEYRGTMVAVKRVLPPDGNAKFDWETRTMAWDRSVTGSSSPDMSTFDSQQQPPSLGSSFAPTDLEHGTWRKPSGLFTIESPSGVRTIRRMPGSNSALPRLIAVWRQHQRLRSDFMREMRVLSQLRHPCVTTVMGAVLSNQAEPALVMELMDHGSLYGMLHNDTVVIEDELALPMLCDIAQGIRFLHAAEPVIVHGDIKSQNVLLDAKFRAKVSDFGLSQKKQVGACGTPFWMAPELLRGGFMSPASDVYAFGILLNEVCTRQDPYAGQDPRTVLRRVKEEHMRPVIPEKCCSHMEALMKECWTADPDVRPNAQELDQRLRRLNNADTASPMTVMAPPCRSLQRAFDEKCDRTEGLLYDVFPKHVADQLRSGKKVEPESREVVTIFFSDIVGFTNISATIEPGKISHMLDRLYTKFDALSREHAVFKVETIGDAYMAVSNLAEDQQTDHAKRIALFAIAAVDAANQTLIDADDPSKGYLNIRVGFHSGPVVANVVGTRNLRYCLFGDTVNTASRMESNSVQNHIHCSSWAASILREQAPDIRLFRRGLISVKGKGEMETFWVSKAPPPAHSSSRAI